MSEEGSRSSYDAGLAKLAELLVASAALAAAAEARAQSAAAAAAAAAAATAETTHALLRDMAAALKQSPPANASHSRASPSPVASSRENARTLNKGELNTAETVIRDKWEKLAKVVTP
jgi:hypothetical protein